MPVAKEGKGFFIFIIYKKSDKHKIVTELHSYNGKVASGVYKTLKMYVKVASSNVAIILQA